MSTGRDSGVIHARPGHVSLSRRRFVSHPWLRGAMRLMVVPLIALAVWLVLAELVFVVPSPAASLRALLEALATASYRVDLYKTIGKVAIAFAAATLIGLVCGSLLGLFVPLRRALQPFMLIANGIPKIVLYPILLLVFGMGGTSQIVMGIIFGALPIIVNLMSALASMRSVYRKVTRMLEVGPLRAFARVYLPAVAPQLMIALQLGFSLTVLGVVYAEIIASRDGLGQELIQTYSVGAYPRMAASVLLILLMSLGGSAALHLLARVITPPRA